MFAVRYAGEEFVRLVFTNPRVWQCLRQDGASLNDVRFESGATYLRWEDHGFVMFRRISDPMCEIHIAMLPKSPYAGPFVQFAMSVMRSRGVVKFLAIVPAWNRTCILGAKREGFEVEGVIKAAYKRDGNLFDAIMLGSF